MKDYWYKKNKTQLLRGFCAVIEEGSTIKASKVLNISHSAISLQISTLEKSLKFKLFERKNQRLIPTKDGLKFYRLSRRFLTDLDFIFKNAKQLINENYENNVKIASNEYIFSYIMPSYFKKMIEKKPNIQFEIHNTSLEEGLLFLNSRVVDFVIFPIPKFHIKKANISYIPFRKSYFGLNIPFNHPLHNVKAREISWNMVSKFEYLSLNPSFAGSRFKIFNKTPEICFGIAREGMVIVGGERLYATWHKEKLIFKECPNLEPVCDFYILKRKGEISVYAKEMLKLMLKD
jgi:DNA-binding transcriptional LysR family regulator